MLVWDLFEWFRHYQEEPWGWEIDNFRTGVVCSTLANMAGRSRKQPDATPADYYPVLQPPEPNPPATAEELEAFFLRMC